jgi:uncharacterized membrane protein YkvA (DUF1232 family)
MDHKEEFVAFLSRSIIEIPQDVKVLFEMLDDGDLGDDARVRVAGSLLYLLAPGDLVPDSFGLLGHADDSLVFRMTMAATLGDVPDRAGHYRDRYPEVFGSLEADLAAARGFLGDVYPWLEERLAALATIEFKGKRAPMFLEDVDEGSWLYDEVNEALLDFEIDEEELARSLRKVDRIVPVMRQKMEASRR